MFRGKYLPGFLERYAPLYRELVEQHGLEKVVRVYDYFFAFMSRMTWGQWMVVEKVCPDVGMRQLLFWVVECVYESDLVSQFRFAWKPSGKDSTLVIECVAPDADEIQRWQWWLPRNADGTLTQRYSLIDWYGRLRQDPKALPEVDPAWLLLSSGTEESAAEDGDMVQDE